MPICCCWTNRPTTWTSRRSPGSPTTCCTRSGAVVAVTHDRWFLDAMATSTWEVVDAAVLGREGGYSDWVFARAERLRLDQAAEERRKNLARKELAWLRRGPPARTSKPRYRIEAAEAIIAGEPEPRNSVELHAFARRRLGKDVLELKDVTATVTAVDGTERTLLDHVDLAGRTRRPDRRRRHQRFRQVHPAAHPGRRPAAGQRAGPDRLDRADGLPLPGGRRTARRPAAAGGGHADRRRGRTRRQDS